MQPYSSISLTVLSVTRSYRHVGNASKLAVVVRVTAAQ